MNPIRLHNALKPIPQPTRHQVSSEASAVKLPMWACRRPSSTRERRENLIQSQISRKLLLMELVRLARVNHRTKINTSPSRKKSYHTSRTRMRTKDKMLLTHFNTAERLAIRKVSRVSVRWKKCRPKEKLFLEILITPLILLSAKITTKPSN